MAKFKTHINGYSCRWNENEGTLILEGYENRILPQIKKINDLEYSILSNGKSYSLTILPERDAYVITIKQRKYVVSIESLSMEYFNKINRISDTGKQKMEVRAPMPGMVVKIEVTEGISIKKSEGLIVLEAMKMENEIKSTRDGVITKILVREKETVEKGQILLIIE